MLNTVTPGVVKFSAYKLSGAGAHIQIISTFQIISTSELCSCKQTFFENLLSVQALF